MTLERRRDPLELPKEHEGVLRLCLTLSLMETPIAKFARWLHKDKNLCGYCRKPLEGGGFCSEECADEWDMLKAF